MLVENAMFQMVATCIFQGALFHNSSLFQALHSRREKHAAEAAVQLLLGLFQFHCGLPLLAVGTLKLLGRCCWRLGFSTSAPFDWPMNEAN